MKYKCGVRQVTLAITGGAVFAYLIWLSSMACFGIAKSLGGEIPSIIRLVIGCSGLLSVFCGAVVALSVLVIPRWSIALSLSLLTIFEISVFAPLCAGEGSLHHDARVDFSVLLFGAGGPLLALLILTSLNWFAAFRDRVKVEEGHAAI